MRKGRVMHFQPWQHGVIEVVDHKRIRTLHFGNGLSQTRMDLDDPVRLVSMYSQRMMTALLFPTKMQRILLIGLGGGCLARFLLHHLPECRVDAVESCPPVVEIAREYFFLAPGERFRVHTQDGLDFMCGAPLTHFREYDLILVDAFDNQGMARKIYSQVFFHACLQRLADDGVVVVNLTQAIVNQYDVAWQEMRGAFGRGVCSLPVPETGNELALAGHPSTLRRLRLRQPGLGRIATLERLISLPLSAFLKELVCSKRPWGALLGLG